MRRVLIAVGVVLLIAARAPQAFGQCSISVLDVNGTPMLCALQGPAPHLSSVCPRPASWWASGCGSGTTPLDADAFARVAAGVDQRSAVWSYDGTPQGLCALLARPRHANSMTSTKRQYAAVLANITATALGIVDYEGHAVGLDVDRTLDDVRGVPAGTTLAQWVASTEQALLSHASDAGHGRSARETLHRIRRQAKDISRGLNSGDCPGQFSAAMEDDDDDDMGEALGTSASALSLGGGDGGDPLTG